MPGTLLHAGATIMCAHGGPVQIIATNPRVKVSGSPVAVQTDACVITGCPPPTQPGPCASAQWTKAATRVFANSIPVLLHDSTAVCLPAGTGLTISTTQQRVKGK